MKNLLLSLIILCTINSCASAPQPWEGSFYAVSPSRGGMWNDETGIIVPFEQTQGWIAIKTDDFMSFYKAKCEAK